MDRLAALAALAGLVLVSVLILQKVLNIGLSGLPCFVAVVSMRSKWRDGIGSLSGADESAHRNHISSPIPGLQKLVLYITISNV